MKITGALMSTAAVLVLASMPRLAGAQCGAAVADYEVNEGEGTIDAWSYVQEYWLPECPWVIAYQYGYFEHFYMVDARLTSPTERGAYNEDFQGPAPYGGGGAYTFTSLLYFGEPGAYEFEWFIRAWCTIGGTLVWWLDSLYVPIETPACTQAQIDGFAASLLFPTMAKWSRYRMYTSDFENRIFRFQVTAFVPDVADPGIRNSIESEGQIWDKTDPVLCGEGYQSDITHAWSSDINSVNVRVSIDTSLQNETPPKGGRYGEQQCNGNDCIWLSPSREPHHYGHEIGHALGFNHSEISFDIMCDGGSGCVAGDVHPWHIRRLLDKYGDYSF